MKNSGELCYKTIIQKISNNNNNIYIKRDDLLPFSFGGNKYRIALEYFCDMKKNNKNVIISYGNKRSNLNRIISNIAFKKNIPCYVINPIDEEDINLETNNSILVNSCNAKYINCSKSDVSITIQKTINDIIKNGNKPYYINGNCLGEGNEHVAVSAYYKVYNEILEQEKEMNIKFDYIFLTSGTGMTQAGLVCGKILNENDYHKIIGISIARNEEIAKIKISNLVNKYLEKNSSKIINCNENDIIISDKYLCKGYGKYNNEIIDVIRDMYKNEGICLDTTYTGKAYTGMLKFLEENNINNKNVLFIHTGGSPLFFDKLTEIFKGEEK